MVWLVGLARGLSALLETRATSQVNQAEGIRGLAPTWKPGLPPRADSKARAAVQEPGIIAFAHDATRTDRAYCPSLVTSVIAEGKADLSGIEQLASAKYPASTVERVTLPVGSAVRWEDHLAVRHAGADLIVASVEHFWVVPCGSRTLRIQLACEEGDWPVCRHLFESLAITVSTHFTSLAEHPTLDPAAKEPFQRGMDVAEEGRPEEAIGQFSRAIEIDPRWVPAYLGRSIAHRELGEVGLALADCTKAIELDPWGIHLLLDRAGLFTEAGILDRAATDYGRALELAPTSVEAYRGRAATRSRQDQVELAILDYDRALELDPLRPDLLLERASVHLQAGSPDLAIADCTRAIELDPRRAECFELRGIANGDLGLGGAAFADLSRAIELAPSRASSYSLRGFARATLMGDPNGATADFDRALELETDPEELPWHERIRSDAALEP